MKQFAITAATIVVLFILQSLPAYRLTDSGFSFNWARLQVDLACIVAIYLGTREVYVVRGALLSMVVGYFANCFAPSSMRIYAFLAPACFLLSFLANIAFYFKRLEGKVLLVFVMSMVYNFSFFYLMRTVSEWHATWLSLFWPVVWQALLNAFFSAVLFTFLDWLFEENDRVAAQRYRL